MADNLSKEKRSKIMGSIRAQSKLENSITNELWRRGYRFRKNTKSLYGTPDISIKKYKIVIFIDSCFWHFCPIHGKKPKSNEEFWEKKLLRNQQRDIEVNNYYLSNGWNLKRIWEHEIRKDFYGVVSEICDFIENIKNPNQRSLGS